MKEVKKSWAIHQNRADKPLAYDELASVTGGLLGAYADATHDYTGDCVTVLVQAEEIQNAKEKGGCGKP